MLFTPCDREATLSPTATPPGLHGAHLWVFIEVMWAMSPVSLYFPNPGQSGPGLGSITFSFSGMFIPGLPLLEYQDRTAWLPSQTQRGPSGAGAVTGSAVTAPNRTRRVSPGTHALGTLQALEGLPLTYCAPCAPGA